MNRAPFAWMNETSRNTLRRGYIEGELPADAIKEAGPKRVRAMADRVEQITGVKGIADKIYDYAGRGWISFSSPVWSNFGLGRGLPISCNGSFVDDTTDSILFKLGEVGMMTKYGAGTSAYFGALRPAGAPITGGGISQGMMSFIPMYQEATTCISQAGVRRGNIAVYAPVESPDIHDFLKIRSEGHPLQHISYGVTITDKWMEEMNAEAKGGEKRKLLVKIINQRRATGYPYLVFIDAANRARHDRLKELELEIYASNLCTEIFLPSSPDESFVCCLSSLNLLHFYEWQHTDLVEVMIYMLDAVISEYIEKLKGERFMADAVRFAERWRALGLGTLGWHSFLQSQMIPFESERARALNILVHETVARQSLAASRKMAQEFGEAPGMEGTGQRHLTLNAIAPTTSSSVILGQVSQSIEPWDSNYFTNDTAKGVFAQRNVHLEALLERKGHNTAAVWEQILMAGGSVMGLSDEILTPEEKAVFKTFVEIDQKEIIRQAADRQPFVDQGQSLNIKVRPEVTLAENVDLIRLMWKSGLKSAYYHKGLNKAQELARANAACVACEA